MVSVSNLFNFLFVVTLLIICHMQMTVSLDNSYEINAGDLGDDLYETLPFQHHRLLHQNFRRASLRYHPHILYKKASLRPFIGHNGRISVSTRDRARRSLPSLTNYD